MENITSILIPIIMFIIGAIFLLSVFDEVLGLIQPFLDYICFGYCAMKINMPFGSPLSIPWAPLPGGFCGC